MAKHEGDRAAGPDSDTGFGGTRIDHGDEHGFMHHIQKFAQKSHTVAGRSTAGTVSRIDQQDRPFRRCSSPFNGIGDRKHVDFERKTSLPELFRKPSCCPCRRDYHRHR